MIKVLFDTNVILDLLCDRQPFASTASQLFQAVEKEQIQGYVAAITLNNLFYIIRKLQGADAAYDAIERILSGVSICPVSQQTLSQAFDLRLKDFEDAIQTVCAIEQNLDYIVTRNAQDFSSSNIAIVSPDELLTQIMN